MTLKLEEVLGLQLYYRVRFDDKYCREVESGDSWIVKWLNRGSGWLKNIPFQEEVSITVTCKRFGINQFVGERE